LKVVTVECVITEDIASVWNSMTVSWFHLVVSPINQTQELF